MKLVDDGGFEGGFMREPYEEPYGEGGTYRGLQIMRAARVNETVRLYNRLGWRVFTHAVGDAAIAEVLAGYESANADASSSASDGESSTRSLAAPITCRA